MSATNKDGDFGQQQVASGNTPYNELQFAIMQMINKMNTAQMVKVVAVLPGRHDGKAGTVDVQPLVSQLDGANQPIQHGTVYGIPYHRIQGGKNAIVVDPVVDDIGVVIFCQNDVSAAKASGSISAPSSKRRFNMADGFYLGGFLNAIPERWIEITDDKIEMTAPLIKINGNTEIQGSLTVRDDVTANGISLESHVHGEVMVGTGESGPPVP